MLNINKKYIIIGFLLTLLFVTTSKAQVGMIGYGRYDKFGLLGGGLGYTSIDNDSYVTITLTPELSFGKIGVGLNVLLLYNTNNGHIRSKDWDESYDYFRAIRYLRYGWKGDDLYTRIGTLDATRIGHGFIMNYYTNEANWDNRKIGLTLDSDFGRYGIETMTSNLGRSEIIGGRFYLKPFKNVLNMPLLNKVIFGATYITDVDPDVNRATENDDVSVYGLDIELPFIDNKLLWTAIYADYAKINNFGSGKAVGVGLRLKGMGEFVYFEARLERRWLGEEFLPSYFDSFYEIDRYVPLTSTTGVYKTEILSGITSSLKGVFGELRSNILGIVDIIGNFQKLDAVDNSGILHINAITRRHIPLVTFQATYDKKNIGSFKDIRTLDNRSIARLGIGYKIKPFLILFMDYIWTFELDEESNQYIPQERYSPRLVFNYEFSM